jgi:hypothetical protein
MPFPVRLDELLLLLLMRLLLTRRLRTMSG